MEDLRVVQANSYGNILLFYSSSACIELSPPSLQPTYPYVHMSVQRLTYRQLITINWE